MHYRKCFLLIALLICLTTSYASHQKYIIEFGIIGFDKNKNIFIKNETRRIPFRTKETGLLFGFIVKSEENFDAHLVVHFPKPPKSLSGNATIAIMKNKTLAYPKSTHSGKWSHVSWFDEGDPVGHWKYDIYINSKLIRSIGFEVFK